jgi:tRNA(adenine34) deaminase
MIAISDALRRLNRVSLEDCTIYANAEPCALCCYALRETRIGRVVFGVPAPLRWNILTDTKLSDTVPEVFAPPPQIVPGFMREQIESAIARRAPLSWEVIRARNIFGGPLPAQILTLATAQHSHTFKQQLMTLLRRCLFDYFGRK